jgi:hypothetical protein
MSRRRAALVAGLLAWGLQTFAPAAQGAKLVSRLPFGFSVECPLMERAL